jgi:hypothetical protein
VTDSNVPEQEPDKPASVGLLGRIRARFDAPVGGALASIAAVGAVAGGLRQGLLLALLRHADCPDGPVHPGARSGWGRIGMQKKCLVHG